MFGTPLLIGKMRPVSGHSSVPSTTSTSSRMWCSFWSVSASFWMSAGMLLGMSEPTWRGTVKETMLQHIPQNASQIRQTSVEARCKAGWIDGHEALAQVGLGVGTGVSPLANLRGVIGTGQHTAEHLHHRPKTVSLVAGSQLRTTERHETRGIERNARIRRWMAIGTLRPTKRDGSMQKLPTTAPSPLLPSTQAVAGVSFRIVGSASPLQAFLCRSLMYISSRFMPWLKWPR
uniref:Uncharacterized protein n=1 Tax=Anopheles dirus TaxID=7168 RepID=A0A182NIT0_9DIPT